MIRSGTVALKQLIRRRAQLVHHRGHICRTAENSAQRETLSLGLEHRRGHLLQVFPQQLIQVPKVLLFVHQDARVVDVDSGFDAGFDAQTPSSIVELATAPQGLDRELGATADRSGGSTRFRQIFVHRPESVRPRSAKLRSPPMAQPPRLPGPRRS